MYFRKQLLLLVVVALCAAAGSVYANGGNAKKVWRQIDDTELAKRPLQRQRVPENYGTFSLDKATMDAELRSAPEEFSSSAAPLYIELPMPDGSTAKFRVVHAMMVEQGLADKYPELARTYRGQGVDDPTATAAIDFLPSGFHAMILSPNGTVVVDPYAEGDTSNYVSYYKRDMPRMDDWSCEVGKGFGRLVDLDKYNIPDASTNDVITGGTLRTYRLALAATGEYTAAVGGGTVSGALAAQVLVMNRVNGVYERDLTLRMVVIANNNLIVYTNGGTDPYTNNDGFAMLGQNQTNLDTVIGTASYDIGHVFSTGGGGVAQLQSPCNASNKAQGVTGLPNPVGDPFAIDFVAHEMGHQWGSNHTFNATAGGCSGNRVGAFSFEPGSGITIMGYAGLCGSQDLAGNSIDTFHLRSLDVIVTFSQVNNGNTCDAETATGNTPPAVTLTTPGPYNVPKQTPFALTASATDVNGDTLTYDWQQVNTGNSANGAATMVPNTDSDGVARPLFRNYVPQSSGTRYFPSLQYIRNNANVPPSQTSGFLTGELMSAMTRALRFDVVVRDNRAGFGGVNSASVTVNVDAASGPFDVTAPNTAVSWAGNSTQTVTWNVANTTAAPVSAANVKITFSADGGLTFPTTILASTANDGTQTITVPNIATTQGRIKVEGENNIFFDMSNVNFTVTAGPAAGIRAPFDYDGDDKTDLSIFRPSLGQWWYQRSSNGVVAAGTFGTSTDRIVPADFTGDQKSDWALFRPSTNEWLVIRSEDSTFFGFPFGASGDTAVTGDFDGDGKADATIHRPSTNTWFILKSTGGTDIIGFGTAGDKPVIADYDGDGKADIAIWRPSVGQWWVRRSSDSSVFAATFGSSADRPVQGFWTADNKADMAFWRPSTGEWYVLRSEDFSFFGFPFGTTGDVPAPGDYDGDDRFDAAVFRPSSNTWFVQRTTAGTLIQAFGTTGDIPTPSAYVP